MPGFTIHIAIGKEYIKKHKGHIQNESEFIKGTIAPDLDENKIDLAKDKSKTHYGKWGNYQVKTNIKSFLQDAKVTIDTDYWKGYLLHLLVDHYFYNISFQQELEAIIQNKDKFYDDYDCLNFELITRFQIEILENVKKYMKIDKNKKEPKYLKKDKVIQFIEEMSNINLEKQMEIIQKEGMEGLK